LLDLRNLGMCLQKSLWHTRAVSLVRVFGLCLLLFALTSVRTAVAQSPLLNEEEVQDNSLPFRGSTFSFGQSLSDNVFSKSSQLSYNPQYLWGFGLTLRWYLNSRFSFALSQGLQLELTDSDITTSRQKPLLSDTSALFDARVMQWRFADRRTFAVHGQAVLLAPTSIASQAATMTIGAQANVAGVVTFQDWMQGVGLGLELSYLHRFLRSNTLHAQVSYPCYNGGSSFVQCDALGSLTNTNNGFSVGLLADANLTNRFALHFVGELAWYHAEGLANARQTTITGLVVDVPDESLTHWRNSRFLELGASYDFFAWFSLGLALSNAFSERGYEGQLRPPLKAADTMIALRVLISLDEVYLAATGARTASAAPIKH
jgi:hypothetical protein